MLSSSDDSDTHELRMNLVFFCHPSAAILPASEITYFIGVIFGLTYLKDKMK